MPCCYIHNERDVPTSLLVVHHKWPTAYGGPDTPENRIFLCASCHDLIHRCEYKIFTNKVGIAKDLISQYLLNQPARQERLFKLAKTAATAKREQNKSPDIPEAGEQAEEETVLVSLDLPYWLHHRLKTLSVGKGLYKYILNVLERHVVVATRMPGAPEAALVGAEKTGVGTPKVKLINIVSTE